MYKVKELIDKGLKVKSLDKELQDDIEALETISDNYYNDDKEALEFDKVLAKELAKHMKEDMEDKPKEKSKPRGRKSKMEITLENIEKNPPIYKEEIKEEPKPEKAKKESKPKKPKGDKMEIPECDTLIKKWTAGYKKRQENKDKPKPTPSEKFEKKAESSANAVVSSVKGSDKEIKAEVKKDVKVIIKGLLSGFKTILMNEDEDTLKSFNKELEALIKKYKK